MADVHKVHPRSFGLNLYSLDIPILRFEALRRELIWIFVILLGCNFYWAAWGLFKRTVNFYWILNNIYCRWFNDLVGDNFGRWIKVNNRTLHRNGDASGGNGSSWDGHSDRIVDARRSGGNNSGIKCYIGQSKIRVIINKGLTKRHYWCLWSKLAKIRSLNKIIEWNILLRWYHRLVGVNQVTTLLQWVVLTLLYANIILVEGTRLAAICVGWYLAYCILELGSILTHLTPSQIDIVRYLDAFLPCVFLHQIQCFEICFWVVFAEFVFQPPREWPNGCPGFD